VGHGESWLRADEARDGGRGFGDLVVRCRAAFADGVGDARIQVAVEELERHGLQAFVAAEICVSTSMQYVVVDHPLHALHLALDPAQPLPTSSFLSL
jgi:hypothetical protein